MKKYHYLRMLTAIKINSLLISNIIKKANF